MDTASLVVNLFVLLVGAVTLALVHVGYRWQDEERKRQRDTRRRMDGLIKRLGQTPTPTPGMARPTQMFEKVADEDRDTVALALERGLVETYWAGADFMVRRKTRVT